MTRKGNTPNAPLDLPLTTVFNRPEAERAAQTLVTYTLTECERLAYIEKYGAPHRPYKPPSGTAFVGKRKGGKGA
jgi:hypothetical protein